MYRLDEGDEKYHLKNGDSIIESAKTNIELEANEKSK
jgi:hypothetical protein